MAESARVVSFVNGINDEHVEALRLIIVLFEANIVEIRYISHFHVLHKALGEVLSLIPTPRLI
jgi:hypothetical protein